MNIDMSKMRKALDIKVDGIRDRIKAATGEDVYPSA